MKEKAMQALRKAEAAEGQLLRSLWLAMAADYATKNRAVLVGGAAVNLHTGSYRPTDIDMIARLDEEDRSRFVDLGFEHTQGDHFLFVFDDGEVWPIEFPDSQVDGEVDVIRLGNEDVLTVIRLESLIIDRLLQATDGAGLTFDDAVRLCVAVYEKADWAWVARDIDRRHGLEPGLGLSRVHQRILSRSQSLLG